MNKSRLQSNRDYRKKTEAKYGVGLYQLYKYGFKLALEVYEKYARKCSICDSENRLVIHHIDGSGESENPNDNLDNLQLMCLSCHMSLHKTKQHEEKAKLGGGYLVKGRLKEYRHEYHIKNKKKICERVQKYYQENKEKVSKHSKEYRLKNAERLKEYAHNNYKENREKILKQQHEYYVRKKSRKD